MILLVMEPGKRLDVWRTQLEMAFPNVKVISAQEDKMALDLAEQYKPTLLVLDYDLPESGPFSIIQKVRATSPSTKYVLLTSSVGQQEMAKMGGADLVHLQNVSIKQFVNSVNDTFPNLLTQHKNKKFILIAGNGDDFFKTLYEKLVNNGYNVKNVRDGAHAMIGIVENPIDLVILDMKLSDFDGLRVMRVLRRIKQDLPIIGISKSGYDIDNSQIERYNAKLLIQPINFDDLLKLIKSSMLKEEITET
ncbi:response regulator [bacterium]|nr:MAG: response regulator [bacterium]